MINIVLCGMMGSGKTTVAAALGRLYCLEIIDTDEEIVKEYGDITSIFSTCGEEKFLFRSGFARRILTGHNPEQ